MANAQLGPRHLPKEWAFGPGPLPKYVPSSLVYCFAQLRTPWTCCQSSFPSCGLPPRCHSCSARPCGLHPIIRQCVPQFDGLYMILRLPAVRFDGLYPRFPVTVALFYQPLDYWMLAIPRRTFYGSRRPDLVELTKSSQMRKY